MKYNLVESIFYGRVKIERATSFLLFKKKGLVQNLLHQLKYKNHPEIAYILGNWAYRELGKTDFFDECDIVIPVPLHKKKQRKRGYNQIHLFAKAISENLKIDLSLYNLVMKYQKDTQTEKSRFDRWEGVKNVFYLSKPQEVENKHILIVDDVITTGATIEACIKAIKSDVKEVKISVLTIAFAS
ncbi:ComF family protein [Ichthyobacterium seriolicida]|nr:phosphoribosyltransferase family protein [Ichthyobacterium seriolicida]